MRFKPSTWYPIAVALAVTNLIGAGFVFQPAMPWHGLTHAALGLAFGVWAQRLRQATGGSEVPARLDELDELKFEVNRLRQELGETQERLDFVERVLAQGPENRRMGPDNRTEG